MLPFMAKNPPRLVIPRKCPPDWFWVVPPRRAPLVILRFFAVFRLAEPSFADLCQIVASLLDTLLRSHYRNRIFTGPIV